MIFIFLVSLAHAAASKPTREILAKSGGYRLQQLSRCSADDDCNITYQILGPKGHAVKNFEISDSRTGAKKPGKRHQEKISVAACAGMLGYLERELAVLKFKKVKVQIDACKGNRWDAVVVNK